MQLSTNRCIKLENWLSSYLWCNPYLVGRSYKRSALGGFTSNRGVWNSRNNMPSSSFDIKITSLSIRGWAKKKKKKIILLINSKFTKPERWPLTMVSLLSIIYSSSRMKTALSIKEIPKLLYPSVQITYLACFWSFEYSLVMILGAPFCLKVKTKDLSVVKNKNSLFCE